MANLKPNHTCIICGKEYYACDDCDKKNFISWRSICCSQSHFQLYHILAQWRDNQITKDEAQSLIINIGIKPELDISTFLPSPKSLAEDIFKNDIIAEEIPVITKSKKKTKSETEV